MIIKIWPCCCHVGGNLTCVATSNLTFGYHHFNTSYLIKAKQNKCVSGYMRFSNRVGGEAKRFFLL